MVGPYPFGRKELWPYMLENCYAALAALPADAKRDHANHIFTSQVQSLDQ